MEYSDLINAVQALEARVTVLEGNRSSRARARRRLREKLENPEDLYPIQITDIQRRCEKIIHKVKLMKDGYPPYTGKPVWEAARRNGGWIPFKTFASGIGSRAAFCDSTGEHMHEVAFEHLVIQILREECPGWEVMSRPMSHVKKLGYDIHIQVPFDAEDSDI
jgi:hypothetical protein